MHKIQQVSHYYRFLFQLMFLALPIMVGVFWLDAPTPIGFPQIGFPVSFIPHGIEILHVLSPITKFYGFLICLIPLFFTELVLYYLIKLFLLYESAEIFSFENVTYIKKMGYALLAGQLFNPVFEALITLNLTWGNPQGHRVMAITVDGTNIGIILGALMTILISWIMAEGCKLREEQQLTI